LEKSGEHHAASKREQRQCERKVVKRRPVKSFRKAHHLQGNDATGKFEGDKAVGQRFESAQMYRQGRRANIKPTVDQSQ